MARGAALLALMATLGCDPGALGDVADAFSDNIFKVTVYNQGTQQVRVIVDYDLPIDSNDFLLDPGGVRSIEYEKGGRLEVRAWRTSDLVEIFDDFWTGLDHDVNVVLTP